MDLLHYTKRGLSYLLSLYLVGNSLFSYAQSFENHSASPFLLSPAQYYQFRHFRFDLSADVTRRRPTGERLPAVNASERETIGSELSVVGPISRKGLVLRAGGRLDQITITNPGGSELQQNADLLALDVALAAPIAEHWTAGVSYQLSDQHWADLQRNERLRIIKPALLFRGSRSELGLFYEKPESPQWESKQRQESLGIHGRMAASLASFIGVAVTQHYITDKTGLNYFMSLEHRPSRHFKFDMFGSVGQEPNSQHYGDFFLEDVRGGGIGLTMVSVATELGLRGTYKRAHAIPDSKGEPTQKFADYSIAITGAAQL